MVNASDIINYNRTDAELEELILFLVCVAGKNADTTARLLDTFFYTVDFELVSPFNQIREINTVSGMLLTRLKESRLGCYTKLEKAFYQLANSKINLRTCTLEELMEIHGVGRKSASCFLAWTREGVKVAMLDTHLLREIADWGTVNVPKSTPASKREYDRLENIYLTRCEDLKVNPTEYDLQIWVKRSSQRLHKIQN